VVMVEETAPVWDGDDQAVQQSCCSICSCACQAVCVQSVFIEGHVHVTICSLWCVRRRSQLPTSRAFHAPAAVSMWPHAGPGVRQSIIKVHGSVL
jgi:hypothetical protein